MNKVIKLFTLLLFVALLASCGNKKSPTGGPEDIEKPTVLTTLPAQFSQITANRIEINFSKPLDKTSVTEAVYIYPPVTAKKITVDKSTLLIRFSEELLPDTNYYVTLSTRLKDIHGNALANNQTLIFAHGKLNDRRISGSISYEDPADKALNTQVTLLSADSLIVLNQAIQGESFALETLNPAPYILRAYIDKDRNGHYDFSKDPYFEQKADVRQSANMDIMLAYADTTQPNIKLVQAKSSREIELTFSEPLASIGSLKIISSNGNKELPIEIIQLRGDKVTLLTRNQDSFTYNVEARQIKDLKGNVNPVGITEFRSSPKDDVDPPIVLSSNPRNGTSVSSLEPVLEVRFSEIIPKGNLKAVLKASESSAEIPLDILQSDSDIYRFKPRQKLQNYRSHVLVITASDISGNLLKEEYKLNFLPLLRSE